MWGSFDATGSGKPIMSLAGMECRGVERLSCLLQSICQGNYTVVREIFSLLNNSSLKIRYNGNRTSTFCSSNEIIKRGLLNDSLNY